MDLPLTLEQLTELIGAGTPADQPLARLGLATHAGDQLSALAEAVLDRFVRAAREAGCSWAEIGTALGVTRQAAHVRFSDRAGWAGLQWPENFTAEARRAVGLAGDAARALGHDYLGTEHVLMALASEDDRDRAARALHELGLTDEVIRIQITRLVGSAGPQRGGALQVAPRLKQAFELGRDHAARLGHQSPGTEHLLLGIVAVDGLATQILSAVGITTEQVRRTLAHGLGVQVSELSLRRRRPGLRRATRC